MNKSILVPLDGSTESEAIFPEVRRVATLRDQVHLLHVVPALPGPVGLEPTHVVRLQDRAADWLGAVRERYLPGQPGLDLIRSGDPAEGIIGEVLERNIHLIAMTTRGRGPVGRLFLGSVAAEVVRRAQLPVLLTRPAVPGPSRPLQKILIALEGGETPNELLDTVKSLAAGSNLEIILFHAAAPVWDPAPVWAPASRLSTPLAPARRLQTLADALEQEGFVAWPMVSEGPPAEEILKQAGALDVDLIALAPHARTGLARMIEGSVAEAVLRHAPVAVLFQKPLVVRKPMLLGGTSHA